MSAFATPLDVEVDELRGTRVNALPSIVAERAAALRFALDRVDENVCDGYATAASPGLDAGTPVEVKSVRVRHHDGTGRIGVHPRTHAALADAGGVYVVVVYGQVQDGAATRIVGLALSIVEPETVGRFLVGDSDGYQKVRWDLLVDADVDRERWSA